MKIGILISWYALPKNKLAGMRLRPLTFQLLASRKEGLSQLPQCWPEIGPMLLVS